MSGSSAAATGLSVTSPPPGWTVGPTAYATNGSNSQGVVALFYKIAVGGETSATVSVDNANWAWSIEEWSGLAASSVVDITFTSGNFTAGGIWATTAGTTTNANDWIYAVAGGRQLSLTSWGDSLTQDATKTQNASAVVITATKTLSATGSDTPSATLSAGLGGIIAIAFKQSIATVSGAATGSLGGISGSVAGIRTEPGAASGSIGGITGQVTLGSIGAATGSLGGLAGSAGGTRVEPAAASGNLGALTGNASGIRVDVGSATGTLGSIDGAATGTASGTPVVISAPLLEFVAFEVLPGSPYLPVIIGADHIQWGFSVLEGEAQDGGGP